MTFKDFNFDSNLIKMLNNINVVTPNEFQKKCFDEILKGNNLLCTSKTNTGKTLTYLIATINEACKNKDKNISSVIIVPTKELCIHVLNFLKKLNTYTNVRATALYGGASKDTQSKYLDSVNIIVATPGRLLDFLDSKELCLKNIKFLVLDEYDEFLNSNLKETLSKIKAHLNNPQTLLFSASETVDVRSILKDYNTVKDNDKSHLPQNIKNHYFIVKNKENLIVDHLNGNDIFCALIFCNSKNQVENIYKLLKKSKIVCDYIHSNLDHNIRTKVVNNFKTGKLQALVTTNLLSRGISFKHLTHVINYDLPENKDIYIQRVGRSGRFKLDGIIYNYCYKKEEMKLKEMADDLGIILESECI